MLFIHYDLIPHIPPVCQLWQDVFEPWPGGVHVEVGVAGALHVAAELLQVVELGGDDHPPIQVTNFTISFHNHIEPD